MLKKEMGENIKKKHGFKLLWLNESYLNASTIILCYRFLKKWVT